MNRRLVSVAAFSFALLFAPRLTPGQKLSAKGEELAAGEGESSNLIYTHPELAHIDRASSESGPIRSG